MVKVMLVDDEVLALEYLKGLVDWEKHGYEIVGSVTSGQKAVDQYEKWMPDIVVSDIRMPGMDGLELTRRLKQMNGDVIVILLSAYKDFDYAQKGIRYGVTNYLLKHELCEEKLLDELGRAEEMLFSGNQKKKIYRKYFMDQLIHNAAEEKELEGFSLGRRLFMVLIHKNNPVVEGVIGEARWESREIEVLHEALEEVVDEDIHYVADTQITSNNYMVLYGIGNISSKYVVTTLIERKCSRISARLSELEDFSYNFVYSDEIRQSEISKVFQRMSNQIRYAVFWDSQKGYALGKLIEEKAEERVAWEEYIKEIQPMVYEDCAPLAGFMDYLFELACCPRNNLSAFRELLHTLEAVIRDLMEKEGVKRRCSERKLYKAVQIREYYTACFLDIARQVQKSVNRKYSKQVVEMIRYIKKNYTKDLSLDSLGEQFDMNGVYLGQVFRKEVGVTFLNYLTSCRIEEAKILLREGNLNISEVAARTGYKSSQYFSQIFIKVVGMKPQEYRKWSKE